VKRDRRPGSRSGVFLPAGAAGRSGRPNHPSRAGDRNLARYRSGLENDRVSPSMMNRNRGYNNLPRTPFDRMYESSQSFVTVDVSAPAPIR
jgi:hypothetical protein